jgi:hypothetical protein
MNDNEPGISSLDWKWDGNGNGETIAWNWSWDKDKVNDDGMEDYPSSILPLHIQVMYVYVDINICISSAVKNKLSVLLLVVLRIPHTAHNQQKHPWQTGSRSGNLLHKYFLPLPIKPLDQTSRWMYSLAHAYDLLFY